MTQGAMESYDSLWSPMSVLWDPIAFCEGFWNIIYVLEVWTNILQNASLVCCRPGPLMGTLGCLLAAALGWLPSQLAGTLDWLLDQPAGGVTPQLETFQEK